MLSHLRRRLVDVRAARRVGKLVRVVDSRVQLGSKAFEHANASLDGTGTRGAGGHRINQRLDTASRCLVLTGKAGECGGRASVCASDRRARREHESLRLGEHRLRRRKELATHTLWRHGTRERRSLHKGVQRRRGCGELVARRLGVASLCRLLQRSHATKHILGRLGVRLRCLLIRHVAGGASRHLACLQLRQVVGAGLHGIFHRTLHRAQRLCRARQQGHRVGQALRCRQQCRHVRLLARAGSAGSVKQVRRGRQDILRVGQHVILHLGVRCCSSRSVGRGHKQRHPLHNAGGSGVLRRLVARVGKSLT
mmetsp:Transcript_1669/g.5367  ORF Transcript_1669/g.5367 Transcript_1669/m.5367 type:complete len:310 (+) Transcript_1669:1416-2345(+)